MSPAAAWTLVFFSICCIGVTKSGFGAGLGLFVVPLLTIATAHVPGWGSDVALGLMLPLLTAGDLIAVWQYRQLFSYELIRRLLPATVLGVAIGTWVLFRLHQYKDIAGDLIRLEIGFESVLLVGLHWWRTWRGEARAAYVPKPWHNHGVGVAAGISSTLAHGAGPIIALFLLPQRLDRRIFVGTCAIYFFLLNGMKIPFYYASGMFEKIDPLRSLTFLPVVIVGALIGFALNGRVSDKLFSRIVYVGTFVLGLYLLVDATRNLIAWARVA